MQGHIAGRTAGLLLLLFGLVVYPARCLGDGQRSAIRGQLPQPGRFPGSVEILLGPLGIAVALLAIVLFAVITQVRIRIRPGLKPGTMEFFVAVDREYRKNKRPFPSNKNVLVQQGVVKHVDPAGHRGRSMRARKSPGFTWSCGTTSGLPTLTSASRLLRRSAGCNRFWLEGAFCRLD